MSNISVRTAVEEDIPAIIAMGAKFAAAIKWAEVEFDPVSFEITVRNMMDPETGGLVIVAKSGDEFTGMAGSLIYPCFFNLHILLAQEVFYWAEPEHRGHVGPRLICGLEDVCKGLGAKVMMVGSVAGLRDKAVAELYARRGYRQGENSFVKALLSTHH